MQGDPEVIEFLNEQLTAELTAINQYFLHAKMQENNGWTKLAKYTRAESFDEMKHAEVLTDRILFLEGLPNYQRLFHVRIGQTVSRDVPGRPADRGGGHRPPEAGHRADAQQGRHHVGEHLRVDPRGRGAPHRLPRHQLELVEKLGEALYIAQVIEQPES